MSTVRAVARFLRAEDGPTAVEYAVLVALVMIACLAALATLGTDAGATIDAAGTAAKPPEPN